MSLEFLDQNPFLYLDANKYGINVILQKSFWIAETAFNDKYFK